MMVIILSRFCLCAGAQMGCHLMSVVNGDRPWWWRHMNEDDNALDDANRYNDMEVGQIPPMSKQNLWYWLSSYMGKSKRGISHGTKFIKKKLKVSYPPLAFRKKPWDIWYDLTVAYYGYHRLSLPSLRPYIGHSTPHSKGTAIPSMYGSCSSLLISTHQRKGMLGMEEARY